MFAKFNRRQCSQPARISLSAEFVSNCTRMEHRAPASSRVGRSIKLTNNLENNLDTYSNKLTGYGVSSRSSGEGRPQNKDSALQVDRRGISSLAASPAVCLASSFHREVTAS